MNWEIGQSLKPLVKKPFNREQLKAYAEASGDGNPIHLDEAFAKNAGFPSVIVHGMLSMAFMGDHLRSNFPTSQYHLVKIRARFRRVTFPGDVLTCEGEIKKQLPDGILQVALRAKNQAGEVTADGVAEVRPLECRI